MNPLRRLYDRIDRWASELSRGRFALFVGSSAAIGVLVVGLLLGNEFPFVQALTAGLVMAALEFVFGKFRTTEE